MKKMSNNEPNEPPANPSGSSPTQPTPSPPTTPLYPKKLTLQETLQNELGLVKVLDYIVGESFEMAFQKNVMQMYEEKLVFPLLGDKLTKSGDSIPTNEDRGLAFLRDEYVELNIQEKTRNVLNEVENVCRQYGLKEPMVKKTNKIYSIIMLLMMIGLFSIMTIESLAAYSQMIMFPMILVMCFVPQVMRNSVMKKWTTFKSMHKEELQNRVHTDIENIRVFIQDVLDDARERMLANKIPLQHVNFILFTRDYKNIKIIQAQEIRGTLTINAQFEYPPGVDPFPDTIPQATIEPTTTVSTDDENDQFIILRNVKFNEEGQLLEYTQSIATSSEMTKIEGILVDCKITPIDRPDEIIKDFPFYNKILCSCGEPIQLKEAKYCITNENPALEFYLIIGNKCKCVKNPFIVFISPGIKDISDQYKSIF